MKKIYPFSIAVLLLFLLNGVKAQTQQNELNPVEFKDQLIGSWEFKYGSDTTGYVDFTTYGTGLDANMKLVSKGETLMEQRIIWAFDKTLNKFIGLSQIKGGDCALVAAKWISKNEYVLANYEDISYPEGASDRTEGTIKSPDLLEIVFYINNNPVNTVTYTRVK